MQYFCVIGIICRRGKVGCQIQHHEKESGWHYGYSTYRDPKGQAVHGDKDVRELLEKAGLPLHWGYMKGQEEKLQLRC